MSKKPVCKPLRPDDERPIQECGTHRGVTLCVGDRVSRKPVGKHRFPGGGTVLGVQPGSDTRGKKELAARVCWDRDEPGDMAYPYLFSELTKTKK